MKVGYPRCPSSCWRNGVSLTALGLIPWPTSCMPGSEGGPGTLLVPGDVQVPPLRKEGIGSHFPASLSPLGGRTKLLVV